MTTPRVTHAVIALEALALVAYVLAPTMRQASLRARADRIASQLGTIRAAAVAARSQSGAWPKDAPGGEAPSSMASHLPSGFAFRHRDYALDWDQWTVGRRDGALDHPRRVMLVSVTADDEALLSMVAQRIASAHFTVGNRLSLIVPDVTTAARAFRPEGEAAEASPSRVDARAWNPDASDDQDR